jgi:hypothetical protein
MWKKHCVWTCVRRQDDEVAMLDYRHSSLVNVPSDIFTCERTLEELFLDSNRIRDLPRVSMTVVDVVEQILLGHV